MSIQDKAIGKIKQAVGDVAGKPELAEQGRREEEKGEAKEDLHRAEDIAQEKAAAVADLERRT